MEGKPLLLLGVTGSIAAYKSVELLRLLTDRGDLAVRVVMTHAATRFVGPLTFAALSGAAVYDDHLAWSPITDVPVDSSEGPTARAGIQHTDLSGAAAAFLVAPATADCIARLAHGLGDDPVSVTALALHAGAPLIVAPAMNPRMWANAAVQENLATLKRRGAVIIGPDEGEMACGDSGTGRMSEPAAIAAATRRALALASRFPSHSSETSLASSPRRVLILSGPTREPIDDVRFLSNGSSGRMGAALAAACWERGDEVTVISGPAAVLPDPWIPTIRVETAAEMLAAAREISCDLVLSPAAIADWRPAERVAGKPEKVESRTLSLVSTPDVLATLMRDVAFTSSRPTAVAFAAEEGTGDEHVARAIAKGAQKGARWIVLNDASQVMGAAEAAVALVNVDARVDTRIGPLPKDELARRLLSTLDSALG